MKKGLKRVISVLVMCALVAMLTACGGKEESTTLRYDGGDAGTIEIKIEAKGDIISKWTQTSTMPGVTAEIQEALEAVVEEYKAAYSAYSNVDYTTSFDNGSFVEKIVIDMTDKDGVQKLVDAGLLPVTGNASKLSMKQTVEGLKTQGYTVVE